MAGPRITCLSCGDVIRSTNRHDWRPCSCFKNEEDNEGCFIDGGDDYARIGGSNWTFTAYPCPFCANDSDLEIRRMANPDGIFVVCGECGARGPVSHEQNGNEQFYWDIWNVRIK